MRMINRYIMDSKNKGRIIAGTFRYFGFLNTVITDIPSFLITGIILFILDIFIMAVIL